MIKKAVTPELFQLSRVQIKAVGISPLLCHNPAGTMKAPSGGTKRGASAIPDPDVEAKAGLYIDADGDFAFPNSAFADSIVSAAELMKLKAGTGRYAPSVATVLRGGLSANHKVELVKLVDPKNGKPLKAYAIDSRRVVIPANGNSVIRSRPRFDSWSATFELLADAGDASLMAIMEQNLAEILRYAGVRVGIGDFRAFTKPKAKGGPFGKYSAVVI